MRSPILKTVFSMGAFPRNVSSRVPYLLNLYHLSVYGAESLWEGAGSSEARKKEGSGVWDLMRQNGARHKNPFTYATFNPSRLGGHDAGRTITPSGVECMMPAYLYIRSYI